MADILFVILLSEFPRGDSQGSSFWKNVLGIIQASTNANFGDGTAALADRIPVFWSPIKTSQPVLPPADLSASRGPPKLSNAESSQELFGIFFRSSLPETRNVSKLLEELVRGLQRDSNITSVDCRAYQPHNLLPEEFVTPACEKGMLIINCMTPSPASEVTFNRWYKDEHIPMLRAVPGWRSSKRYILLDSRHHTTESDPDDVPGNSLVVPKYLALHEWTDDRIFQSKEFKAAVDTSLRSEVMDGVQEIQRFVVKYVGTLEEPGLVDK